MGRDPTFLSALMWEGKKGGDQVNGDKVAGVAPHTTIAVLKP